MYKTIKISGESYKKAKSLTKELERGGNFEGVNHVSLSNAIGYAITKTLKYIRMRHKLIASSGGWSDINSKKLIDDIYRSRRLSRRPEVEL